MKAPSGQYFFVSYSRADAVQQQKIVAELRGRGVNVWVDTENLVPGSPAWEREIEKMSRTQYDFLTATASQLSNSLWESR